MQVDFLVIVFWLLACILTFALGVLSFSFAHVFVDMMKAGFYWLLVFAIGVAFFLLFGLTIVAGIYSVLLCPLF